MKNNRLIAVVATVAALVCVALVAVKFAPKENAAAATSVAGDLVEGNHYRVLSKPLTVPADGVSVIEFFWYGCPHCQSFEPVVKEWLAGAPSDINFELKPVAWNDATRLHAAMYYTGRNARPAESLHEALFEQIIGMRQERDLNRQVELVSGLFAEYGIDEAALQATLTSPETQGLVKQAEQDMRTAEVSSTPTLLIGGKYLLLNNEAVAEKGMFEVVDALIEMARQ